MSDYGDEVYVCWERNLNPKSQVQWEVAGVVSEEEDAEMWVEPTNGERRYFSRTIGVVESFHTQHLDTDTAE